MVSFFAILIPVLGLGILRVYDVIYRLLKEEQVNFVEGLNQVKLSLPFDNGIYCCQLEIDNELFDVSVTKKI